jgi:alpha-tubulin suppressor-like RCC1 family protein
MQVAVGSAHTCALLQGGLVSCWGRGDSGQLGTGDTLDRYGGDGSAAVAAVALGAPAQQVVCGHAHTCALMVGGAVKCWGLGAQVRGLRTSSSKHPSFSHPGRRPRKPYQLSQL